MEMIHLTIYNMYVYIEVKSWSGYSGSSSYARRLELPEMSWFLQMIMRLLILRVIPFLLGQISSSPISISRGLDLDYETGKNSGLNRLDAALFIFPHRFAVNLHIGKR